MKTSLRAVAVLALALVPLVAADSGRKMVGKPAPELVLQVPGQPQKLLSEYRGKVVALEFIFTTCVHCQHSSQLMAKLQPEYAARGFQTLAVAFNPMAVMLVPDFVKQFHINFPVASTAPETVQDFMGITPEVRLMVPQLYFIDRKGIIRAHTPPEGGDENFMSEKSIRAQIEKLLADPAGGSSASTKSKTKAKAN
jgi:peroxiredoxin